MAKERKIKVGVVDGRYNVYVVEYSPNRWFYEIGRGGDMGCGGAYPTKEAAKECAIEMAAKLEQRIQARYASMLETIRAKEVDSHE
jgi:hypothetical protein